MHTERLIRGKGQFRMKTIPILLHYKCLCLFPLFLVFISYPAVAYVFVSRGRRLIMPPPPGSVADPHIVGTAKPMGIARAHGMQARYGELTVPSPLAHARVWGGVWNTIVPLPTGTHKSPWAGYVTDPHIVGTANRTGMVRTRGVQARYGELTNPLFGPIYIIYNDI